MGDEGYKRCTVCNTSNLIDRVSCTLCENRSFLDTPVTVGGTKHDAGKPDFTFISYELLEAMAQVRAFGEKKYSFDNWKQDFKYRRSAAACLRHVYSFLKGEDNDPESGLSHIAHAACCLEHLLFDIKQHKENDNRKST